MVIGVARSYLSTNLKQRQKTQMFTVGDVNRSFIWMTNMAQSKETTQSELESQIMAGSRHFPHLDRVVWAEKY